MSAPEDDETETSELADGTGGLTLGPPLGPDGLAMEIGFAPDLDGAEPDALFEPALPVTPARKADRRYPIAEAALDRLLGLAPIAELPPSAADPLKAFSIGEVALAPAAIATPAPDPVSMEGRTAASDLDPNDLVEMLLVGQDDGSHQVHLAFKEEVMGGLYVTLERRPDGLFATFLVDDVNDRRHLEGTIGSLLARLQDRGMRIAGHEIKINS